MTHQDFLHLPFPVEFQKRSVLFRDYGKDLHAYYSRRSSPAPVSLKDIAWWLLPLLQALTSLAVMGIRHNDIKPSNICWNETTKQLTLIDFEAATIGGAFFSPTCQSLREWDRD